MAQLDVSDLLLDPEFVDDITLINRTTEVDEFGMNILEEEEFDTIGSVQPASYKQIQRLPEALRQADVRSFFVKMEIKTDGSTVYPDLIEFQGRRYQVQSVAPWLNYGRGWCEGICVEETPAP